MEQNDGIAVKESHKEQAYSLVELMVVLAIIGIIAAITLPNLTFASNKVSRYEVKTHLLRLQLEQENNWLLYGHYKPLTDLPPLSVNGAVMSSVALTPTHYEFNVTMLFLDASDTCRTLTITEASQSPSGCWGNRI
jgi:type IV pilus assembly protein PilE